MLAMWNGRGIRLNYLLSTDPENVNLDDETDVPDYANEAIILNLAIKIAPSHGKSLSPDTTRVMRRLSVGRFEVMADGVKLWLPEIVVPVTVPLVV